MIDLAYATVRWWRVRPKDSWEPPWLVYETLTGTPLVRAGRTWDAIAWCYVHGWTIHADSDERILSDVPDLIAFVWSEQAARVEPVAPNERRLLAAERLGRPTRP